MNLLLDELAADADLVDENGRPALSAHTLRHTFGTNLTRSGVDVVTVAQLMGHKRLETTRRYTLPTTADRDGVCADLALALDPAHPDEETASVDQPQAPTTTPTIQSVTTAT